jgi:Kef-type K+ transport system membrane component KefB
MGRGWRRPLSTPGGALEVVVGTVGLSAGVLGQSSYAAIVVMAMITSAIAGRLVERGRERTRRT